MKSISLTKDISIPAIGLGTWQLTGNDCVEGVAHALKVGYGAIDTADIYGNHAEVQKGIEKSGVVREDIFITTKVWNDAHSNDGVLESGKRFLNELGISYIDLLLIHWPIHTAPVDETLWAMKELQEEGVVRAIGVSNFTIHHIEDALKAGVEIVNNQVEIRPQFNQKALRDFCASKNISVTAYSSLRGGDLEVPLIVELAQKYNKTPSQIILNWVVMRGMVAIPKSSKPERIAENLEAQNFEIDEADLARIDALPQTTRTNIPSFEEFSY